MEDPLSKRFEAPEIRDGRAFRLRRRRAHCETNGFGPRKSRVDDDFCRVRFHNQGCYGHCRCPLCGQDRPLVDNTTAKWHRPAKAGSHGA